MATSTRLYEKWDMMPDNIRLEYMELIDVLNESELTTLAAKIISPIYMLKLLFNMLSTCVKWGAHTECAKYLKQFYDSKEEKNQDEIKLDPHAYFTQIYGGWGNFPVENMILMKEFYDSDKKKFKCLKEMVDNQNIEMMSLALRIRGKGERNRKILPDTLLPECIIAMSSKWKSYFNDNGNGTSSGRKVVDERALAFTSLLEWGEKHYELAKQAYVLLSVEEQTDIQNSMDANGLTEERYLNYWQEKLTIGTMPVDTPEDIANKLEAVETLQKDDWLEALESTKQKLINVLDFGKGYHFCKQKEDDDLEGWDRVSYADLGLHLSIVTKKIKSQGIFQQAIYPVIRAVENDQREIETGVKNAVTNEDNWKKSTEKAEEANLKGVTKRIAGSYYNKTILPSESIDMYTPQHMAIYNAYATERAKVAGEPGIGHLRDISRISYCSGIQAYIKAIAMEWVFVAIIDKIMRAAEAGGYASKVDEWRQNVAKNVETHRNKVFHTPVYMYAGIYAILPNQLLSLVELEDVKTGDNEKRKALKDFFESDLPICEKAFHDTFTDHSNVIPNMQTLSSFRDFQQKTNMVGILISDVDLLSIVFKVHPDLAGCPGKPQADSLKILQENRDILSEVICSATTSLFRRQKLLCSGLTMEVYLSNVYSLLIKHWDSTDAYEMEDTVAGELFTVLTSIVSKENKKGFFPQKKKGDSLDQTQEKVKETVLKSAMSAKEVLSCLLYTSPSPRDRG